MLGIFFILLVTALAIFLALSRKKKQPVLLPSAGIIAQILQNRVAYYQHLSTPEQQRFCKEASDFMKQVKTTGIKTAVTDEDRVLIAASGIIPIFAFPGWRYPNLDEVLLYPDTFTRDYDYTDDSSERNILGMVGSGPMNKIMILSQPALQYSYANPHSNRNTAIHEFTHLIDKTDGEIDGFPGLLMDKEHAGEWRLLIHQNIEAIRHGHSDIDPYAATSEAEFFAVIAEYFFERPRLFEQIYPELFQMMESIFRQRPMTDIGV
ncbi:MAG: M90 family metallopeptidase [Chitinophagaceae bacterium]